MRTEAPSRPRRHGAAADHYASVRNLTECLAAPLSPEDQAIQSMPDVSPTKWHRAHTTWFFETFLLGPNDPTYSNFHARYEYLFNSYYEAVGPRHPRAQRGLLSRPSAADIARYRCHVDAAMQQFVDQLDATLDSDGAAVAALLELGLHHEQQHQELLLMDIKHVLSVNPLLPAYRDDLTVGPPEPNPVLRWTEHEGGLVEIGHDGNGFAFDNESPRHTTYLQPFALADRPVTCADWLEFIADDGYDRPELWLSDGWALRNAERWGAPPYWSRDGDEWNVFTLAGPKPVDPAEPVCHISYYEADAYAHWRGARLPTEAEWETIAALEPVEGNFLDLDWLHPRATGGVNGSRALFGDVWEWTASAYLPYPGFHPAAGAVGEYNGKFMVNQHVLRGGCCATPPDHTRATYRNFFPPASRWAFSGARLAKDAT
jgi:ergothioneine biosynthesis protein EgtB